MSDTPNGPSPRRAARREFLRALRDLALWPARLGAFSLERDAIAGAVRRDLDARVPDLEDVDLPELGDRPLRILLSCGETSGEASGDIVHGYTSSGEGLGDPFGDAFAEYLVDRLNL